MTCRETPRFILFDVQAGFDVLSTAYVSITSRFFMSRVLHFYRSVIPEHQQPFPLEADFIKRSTMQYETLYHGVQVLTG